jgi:hypothetical protein
MAALDHQGGKVPMQWQMAALDGCSSGSDCTLVQNPRGMTCLLIIVCIVVFAILCHGGPDGCCDYVRTTATRRLHLDPQDN